MMVAPNRNRRAGAAAGALDDIKAFAGTAGGKLVFGAMAVLLVVTVLVSQGGEGDLSVDGGYLRDSVFGKSRVQPLDLDFAEGSPLILNIGSSVDPIVPRLTDDPCTVAVAFEPVAYDQVPPHPGLFMVPAAVSDEASWNTMKVHNVFGVSSSLAAPTIKAWQDEKDEGKTFVVPILNFLDVMKSLHQPPTKNALGIAQGRYKTHFIKTDMQGFDFQAFSAIPPHLWKNEFQVPYLMTETYLDGVVSYAGVKNDLCWDWLPYMQKAGYVFEGSFSEDKQIPPGYDTYENLLKTCKKQGTRENTGTKIRNDILEANVYWRHPSAPPISDIDAVYKYPTHGSWGGPKFDDAQYARCKGHSAAPKRA